MIDARFNVMDHISEKISYIKSALKEKYGEKYYSFIDERIDSMTFLPYFDTGQMNIVYISAMKQKSKELVSKFFKGINVEMTKETIQNYFEYDPNFMYYHNFNISKVFNYFGKDLKDYVITDYLNAIEKITGEKVEYKSDRFNELVNQLMNYKEVYDNLLAEYKEFEDEYSDIKNLIKEEENNKQTVNKKYEKIYLEFIKQYMTKEDIEKLDNPFMWLSNLSCYEELVGSNYQNRTMFDAFTKESMELLNGEASFSRSSVVSDQIRYFKKHGIDVSREDFEEFRKSPLYNDNLPSSEIVEKVVAYRNLLHEKEINDVIKMSPSWKFIEEKLVPLNLVDPISEITDLITRNITCVYTSSDKDNNYVNALLFDLGHSEAYLDDALVHEFEHIITTPVGVRAEGDPGYSGFEVLDGDKIPRIYEQMNEIINELEAQETTTLLHDKEIYLLNNSSNAKIKGGTNYERNRVFVTKFYETFKDAIREARFNCDLSIIYDAVGKENFEDLVSLLNDFTSCFANGVYYRLMESFNKNEVTEDTIQYDKYLQKSAEIFDRMKEYSLGVSNALSA